MVKQESITCIYYMVVMITKEELFHTIGCIRMMNTSDYVLLYIVVITIVYCSVGVMMKMYGV